MFIDVHPKLSRKGRQFEFLSSSARKFVDGGNDTMNPNVFQIGKAIPLQADLPVFNQTDNFVILSAIVVDLGKRFFSTQELKKAEVTTYFRLIPQYSLNLLTRSNVTEDDCKTDAMFNVLDISALSSRILSNQGAMPTTSNSKHSTFTFFLFIFFLKS
uniref:Uncharacterized protein n=1 Tax=Panagrolaimus davidi TaxID=227884 RepID=A0A914PYF1_9BILA